MKNNRAAIYQLSNMILITILTQIFTLIINSLIASRFGAGTDLDAYYFSTNITNFIYSFIGAGIATVIIPYLRIDKDHSSVNVFITIIYSIAIFLLIVLLLFRSPFISILSGGKNANFINIASDILILSLFTGFFNSILSLAQGMLQFNGLFNRQKLILLITTALTATVIWGKKDINIYFYAWLVLIAAAVNLLCHIWFVMASHSYKYRLSFNLKNDKFIEMMKLFFPAALGMGVYQISVLIDTMIAARLPIGSITILNYANAIVGMINLLFLANLTSYFYPKLVKNETDKERNKNLVKYSIFITTIMCLIIVLFILVGKDAIRVLFERGNFTSENTNLVYICVVIYAISLPTNGVRDLIYKYFYIKKNTLTPLMNGILISVLNAGISIILSIHFGLYGVIIGTTLASYISLFLITVKLIHKFHLNYSKNTILVENIKIVLVSSVTILLTAYLKKLLALENIYFDLFINSVIAIILFAGLLFVTKSKFYKIRF